MNWPSPFVAYLCRILDPPAGLLPPFTLAGPVGGAVKTPHGSRSLVNVFTTSLKARFHTFQPRGCNLNLMFRTLGDQMFLSAISTYWTPRAQSSQLHRTPWPPSPPSPPRPLDGACTPIGPPSGPPHLLLRHSLLRRRPSSETYCFMPNRCLRSSIRFAQAWQMGLR